MDEKALRNEIQKLIEKFERVKAQGRYKSYNEENTKKDFILPLFRALGWNVEDSNEVKAEERVSKKRVDYAFRINGIPKFYLECKPFKEFISEPKYMKQAIEYAWNTSVTWAILCNFEGIRVLNAEWEWDEKQPLRNQFLDIRYTDYLGSRYEHLTWLSRESFEQRVLDEQATNVGKMMKRIPITKQLLNDFTSYRKILSNDIAKHNQGRLIQQEEIDEVVQRILDRIIFIRTCEDKEIESDKIQTIIRLDTGKEGSIINELNKRFQSYNTYYDSRLFEEHLCKDVYISNEILGKIIQGTYCSRINSINYDFSAINADVLGIIYEQYLGHILKKTQKSTNLTNGKSYRKEQGIYYTPTYIVEYIVRNTLGVKLASKNDYEQLKILDPACGSGSFLIKAFDLLSEKVTQKEGRNQQAKFENISNGDLEILKRKTELMIKCIYGVDLDSQAVEITQLNLLLKLAEKRHRLPMLKENIRVGNTLFEEKEYAGERAFDWTTRFKDIMNNGGFDVIVGNPPYVDIKGMPENQVDNIFKKYSTATNRINLYSVFIHRAIDLLKPKGILGFIIPNSLLYNSSYSEIRKKILKETNILNIVRLPDKIFPECTVETMILILEKKI